ncbi:cornifelin -like protein [Brachionus plicatilis]|uniref:Cornifelin-like protein n=1 Tax=Brachionus plicatilis TaxID=10195 RepID=A0A3M7P3F6_BRAPC|nr:cornifelin -like protein [Brachionus plicatilis]
MQDNQLYPNFAPSAPVMSNATIYQQGDYLLTQTPQQAVYYQPQPIIVSSGANQGLSFGLSYQQNQQWSSGLCNCFSDFGECCFAFFCPLCYQIKLFNDADETCCSCLFGGLVPLRTKIRMKNNIEIFY